MPSSPVAPGGWVWHTHKAESPTPSDTADPSAETSRPPSIVLSRPSSTYRPSRPPSRGSLAEENADVGEQLSKLDLNDSDDTAHEAESATRDEVAQSNTATHEGGISKTGEGMKREPVTPEDARAMTGEAIVSNTATHEDKNTKTGEAIVSNAATYEDKSAKIGEAILFNTAIHGDARATTEEAIVSITATHEDNSTTDTAIGNESHQFQYAANASNPVHTQLNITGNAYIGGLPFAELPARLTPSPAPEGNLEAFAQAFVQAFAQLGARLTPSPAPEGNLATPCPVPGAEDNIEAEDNVEAEDKLEARDNATPRPSGGSVYYCSSGGTIHIGSSPFAELGARPTPSPAPEDNVATPCPLGSRPAEVHEVADNPSGSYSYRPVVVDWLPRAKQRMKRQQGITGPRWQFVGDDPDEPLPDDLFVAGETDGGYPFFLVRHAWNRRAVELLV